MHRPLALALACALTLPRLAPAARAADFSLPVEREIRLSGRLIDTDSGAGIPGATIRTPTAVGTTRYDGSFSLDFKARGSVECLFEKEGYYPEPVGVAQSGGVALTVKMKQRMATLYGIVAGCAYDGKTHRWDDMSGMRVEVTGQAVSGQLVNLALHPERDGGFIVLNLPVGDYVVSAGGKTAEVHVKRADEQLTVALTHRWCMRKEFHPDVDAAQGPAEAEAKARAKAKARADAAAGNAIPPHQSPAAPAPAPASAGKSGGGAK